MVPLCNIEEDTPLFIIDILYSKKLFYTNHLIAYNFNGQLDLGTKYANLELF